MARILVIDDEAPVRAAIGAVLRRDGHHVTMAADGEDGLGKFQPDETDLVVTDIVMPRMEGIETMRALRRVKPMVKILAMSGSDSCAGAFYLKAAAALGADATLRKPFGASELRQSVGQLLATTQPHGELLWYRQPR